MRLGGASARTLEFEFGFRYIADRGFRIDQMSPLIKSRLRMRVRKPKKRSEKERVDRRSALFHAAGIKLLAGADYENVSIAMIAKEAGSSVGAFYYRYPDKAAYLGRLIADTFGRLETEYERKFLSFEATKFRDGISLSEFISHFVDALGRPETIGIIRASLKLGTIDPGAVHELNEYRRRITADAGKLFSQGKSRDIAPVRIRQAVQIIFAAVIDAAQMPDSAELKAGGAALRAALCEMTAAYLGVSRDFSAMGNRNARPAESAAHAKHRVWKESLRAESDSDLIGHQEPQAKNVKRSGVRRILI